VKIKLLPSVEMSVRVNMDGVELNFHVRGNWPEVLFEDSKCGSILGLIRRQNLLARWYRLVAFI
jgi:hypothetical protein